MAVLTRDGLKLMGRILKTCKREIHVPALGECWIWQRSTNTGYGQIRLGTTGSPVRVHRKVYEIMVGPITDGLHVCHRCDVRACCNPRHLFLGDDMANHLDKKAKDRSNRGSRHGHAVLDEGKVAEIRTAISAGEIYGRIAERYGVCRSTISFIASGKTWLHVDGPRTTTQGKQNILDGQRRRWQMSRKRSRN